MKIITNNSAYIQIKDLEKLFNSSLKIPKSIEYSVYLSSNNTTNSLDKNDFISFNNPSDIEYFNNINWMIDYNKLKDYSLIKLIKLAKKIEREQEKVSKVIDEFAIIKNYIDPKYFEQYELLDYQLYSLFDIIKYKLKPLQKKLPKEIQKKYKKRKKTK